MRVEVVICTWNRAQLLDQTLASMHELIVPPDVEWELLVINNHSSDETDDVIARHTRHLPLRRIWEASLGKSFALNTAIDAARGDLILWTDDDVLVDRNWLSEHVAAARKYPEAGFFGGTIAPWYEVDPPNWVAGAWDYISAAYAAREFDDGEFLINMQTLPFGANWAIRTELQRQYRYDVRLGRVGPSDVRGEETAILQQMVEDGIQGRWIPQARLRHFIPEDRLTLDFLCRFFDGIGQTSALMAGNEDLSPMRRRLRGAYYRAKIAIHTAKYHAYRHTAHPSRWVKALSRASRYRGKLSRLKESCIQTVGDQLGQVASDDIMHVPFTQDAAISPSRDASPQETAHVKRAA